MSNLFISFDPVSWMALNLNWISCFTALGLFPPLFWQNHNQASKLMRMSITFVMNEFKAFFTNKLIAPGVYLIPTSIFLYILFSNISGLLPYVFSSSSHLVFSMTLAIPTWGGLFFFMWLKSPINFYSHLTPRGCPKALAPFMVCIELVSNLIRPITLSVRLMANIVAGHLILIFLSQSISENLYLSPILFLMLIILMTLETAVAIIQSFVFALLSASYSSDLYSQWFALMYAYQQFFERFWKNMKSKHKQIIFEFFYKNFPLV